MYIYIYIHIRVKIQWHLLNFKVKGVTPGFGQVTKLLQEKTVKSLENLGKT